MLRWLSSVASTAPRATSDCHRRARSVPLERFWISEASVALPHASRMTRVERRVRLDERRRAVSPSPSRAGTPRAAAKSSSVSRGVASLVASGSRIRRTWWISSSEPARDEVADEADPGQEELGLERRDVRAVADARLEHADERERAHRLAQRAARDAEPLRQLPLRRQPRARRELAGADQLLDLRDRLVGGAAGCRVLMVAP